MILQRLVSVSRLDEQSGLFVAEFVRPAPTEECNAGEWGQIINPASVLE